VAKGEGLTIEPGAAAVLARAAEGSLRDAFSLLEQAIAYCDRSITDAGVRELLGVVSEEALDEMVGAIAACSAQRALALVHRMISSGEDLDSFCREAIRHLRNLLVVRVAGADSPLVAAAANERPRLERQAAQFSEEDLTRFFQILLATHADLRRHVEPRIHLEMGLLRLVNAGRLGSLEELIAELRGASPARTPATEPVVNPAPPAQRTGRGRAESAPAAGEAGPSGIPVSGTLGESHRDPETGAPLRSQNQTDPVVLSSVADRESTGIAETAGLTAEQVQALRAAVIDGQQKFLASLLDHVARWELAGDELRLYIPAAQRALAEMLQAHEPMEKLRSISSQALGQALRVCVKLTGASAEAMMAKETGGPSAAGAGDLRAQFERDPAVQAVLDRFGGRISGVKPAGGR
jgi:DNA polymerase-3 subunit gamma/tau